jgi:ARG and Rhodanese-Phosphatase-superfamily-associated Protein domain
MLKSGHGIQRPARVLRKEMVMTAPGCRSILGRFRRSKSVALCAVALFGTMWSAHELRASGQSAQTPPRAPSGPSVTLDGPFSHENLSVYVVRGSTSDARAYITLDQGLTARTVAVREKGAQAGRDQAAVNTLEVENGSDKWLFLQAGDIVKGGKQDRTIMTDVLLAPRSGPQSIDAFCVEHGRWTASQDGLAFKNNPGIVAGASLKRAIQSEKSQPRVWQEVAKAEEQAVKVARAAGASFSGAALSTTGTYNAIAEHKTLSGNRSAYVKALLPHLRKHKDAIGLAVAINGKVTSADVYASPALFQALSEKLLNSSALEALLAQETAQQMTPPRAEQVTTFLSTPVTARAATETVGASMQRSTRETKEAVMYEYGHLNPPTGGKRGIVVVHQSYVKK